MGRFALLGLLVAGTALALASGGGGPARHGEGGDPAAPEDGGLAVVAAVSGESGGDVAGERLVLAVVGNERSGSAVHGERAVVADPRTGELNSFVLPGGTLCHGPLMAVGDRVVFSGYRGSKAFAMSLPLTLDGEPASLGRADTITPSVRPGRVWLGQWNHRGKRSRVTFREVATPGEEATSRADGAGEHLAGDLPRWSLIHATLPGGVVIERRGGLALWEGDRVRPLRGGRRAWPVAAGASRFAWCREPCRSIRVRTPAGERTLTAPAHLRPQPGSGGTFSPGGRRLALPVTHRARSIAAVIDLRTEKWTTVPGGRLAAYGAMAWSRSTGRLYLATAGGGLRAWEPGAPHAERLPVDPGGTVMSIATAP
jgi:hypothetical protein